MMRALKEYSSHGGDEGLIAVIYGLFQESDKYLDI